jgi:prevent-host-death family protein
MTDVASRELRNQTRALLDRVAAGEEITITVEGRPVAMLCPPRSKPRWMPRDRFADLVVTNRADPGLAKDLAELTGGETTDDLPLR